MSEWKEYRLGDIADCSLGKMLDQRKNQGLPRPYLNNVSLRWGSFNIDNTQTMLFEDSELERFQIKKNDIVMCEGGEPGRCAVWTEESPICYQKALHRIRVKEGFDNWFVYYYLRQFVLSGKAKAYFSGTTILHLPLQALKSLEIKAPDIEEQRRIASILSSLDDKIAINRRICENLEAQAQALFKHWFIDFAPFKDGKFVESELGMIPEGWRVGTMSELGKIICGKTPSKANKSYYGGDIPFIKIPDMHGKAFVLNSEDSLTEEGNKSQINKLIPAFSILVSCIATVGLVSMNIKPSQTNQQINTVVPNEPYYRYYIYENLKLRDKELLMLGSSGTTTFNVNTKTFSSLKILIPDAKELEAFDNIIKHIFEEVLNLYKESTRLSTLRDTLLPKLMAGEIKV